MGQGIVRVVRDGLLKQTAGLRKRIVVHAIQQIDRLQDKIVGGQVLRMRAQRPHQLPLAHLRRDRSDDADGDAILKGEEIAKVAFVLVGTDEFSRFGVTELGADTQRRAGLLYAAIKDVTNAELAADLAHVDVATAIAERRSPRDTTKSSLSAASPRMMS